MNAPGGAGDLPPVLGPCSVSDSAPAASSGSTPRSRFERWRGPLALLALAAYVAVPGILGLTREAPEGALLPSKTGPLLWLCGVELAVFGMLFAAVAWSGRLGTEDLLLRPRGVRWLLPRSFAYSVGLRVWVGVVLGACLAAWQLARGAPIENLEELRPKVESMVEVGALRDPVYFGLMISLVSFGLAGLREELWRAGMVVLLTRTFPRWFGGRIGRWLALVPIAAVFGMAHVTQGALGIAATTLLGLGLGGVMLMHRSLWDAVLAHGFFNASTFVLLLWLADRWPALGGGG